MFLASTKKAQVHYAMKYWIDGRDQKDSQLNNLWVFIEHFRMVETLQSLSSKYNKYCALTIYH